MFYTGYDQKKHLQAVLVYKQDVNRNCSFHCLQYTAYIYSPITLNALPPLFACRFY